MDPTRREEWLESATSAVRALGADDPEGYFAEFKAMQLENCSDRDRAIIDSLTWDEIRARIAAN